MSGFSSRWLRSALVLLAAVALLAALTPTSLLLSVGNAVWHAVGPTLAQPVVALLGQTSTRYVVVHGGSFGRVHYYGRRRLRTPTYHGRGATAASSSWVELLLWIVLAGVLAYLARAYWRHRFHGMPWRVALLGPVLPALGRLRFVLAWSLDVVNVHLPDQFAVLLPGAGSGIPGTSRRRFGRPSPRERIGLYYLGVLHRARRCGIPCPPWRTPREYALVLGAKVADAQDNLTELSDVFVEARYSRHELTDRQADHARADARRVREALRNIELQRGRDAELA